MKLLLSILIILSLASCKDKNSFIQINPEPKNYSWWMRADYFPEEKFIRGISIKEISKEWCSANEFTKYEFEKKLTSKEFQLVSSSSFEVTGNFNGAHKTTVISGVFQKCDGERGNFVLSLTDKNTFLSVTELNTSPHYMVIYTTKKPDEIEIWWCHGCDDSSLLKWDKRQHAFAKVQIVEPGFISE